jgi:hypothetical protein
MSQLAIGLRSNDVSIEYSINTSVFPLNLSRFAIPHILLIISQARWEKTKNLNFLILNSTFLIVSFPLPSEQIVEPCENKAAYETVGKGPDEPNQTSQRSD